jgi:hypothetical protein
MSSVVDTDLIAVGDGTTVFRAYERAEFLEWPAWKRLQKILRANGGSYGLSGPRGAGKTWLMLRAIEWIQEGEHRLPGIGLWYPSPSEYDSLAFLASLSDSLATTIERWYRRSRSVRRKLAISRFLVVGVAGAAFWWLGWLLLTQSPWVEGRGPWVLPALLLAGGLGARGGGVPWGGRVAFALAGAAAAARGACPPRAGSLQRNAAPVVGGGGRGRPRGYRQGEAGQRAPACRAASDP